MMQQQASQVKLTGWYSYYYCASTCAILPVRMRIKAGDYLTIYVVQAVT